MVILGINGALNWDGNQDNGWVHGSGATLLIDNEWKGSVSEERFSRIKYDGNFPEKSIERLLEQHNLKNDDVDIIAYTTNLINHSYSPDNKLFAKFFLKKIFKNSEVVIVNHHESHAASAFLTSPYHESSVFTLDNAGDYVVINNNLVSNYGCFGSITKEPFSFLKFTSLYSDEFNESFSNDRNLSVGHFYNLMSVYILSLINLKQLTFVDQSNVLRESASGKVMGLAAYGKKIELSKNIFRINQTTPYEMPTISSQINFKNPKFQEEIFNYNPEDLALWTQEVFEETILTYLSKIPKHFKKDYLCYSGGCALNILLNSKIISEGLFKDVHIPTAPNDDGLSLGGAMLVAYERGFKIKLPPNVGCVGLEYKKLFNLDNTKISYENDKQYLQRHNLSYREVSDTNLNEIISENLKENKIVAWFQGRSEFGPRALGSRSILANACFNNKDLLNQKVKKREYWRPYAAVVLEENLNEWFDCPKNNSHYMLFSSIVKEDKQKLIPSIVHEDNTCRVQTVSKNTNNKLYELLKSFYEKTKVPILLNTSFNTIPGEPIVETPEDAVKSFTSSNIDILVINNFIITKN